MVGLGEAGVRGGDDRNVVTRGIWAASALARVWEGGGTSEGPTHLLPVVLHLEAIRVCVRNGHLSAEASSYVFVLFAAAAAAVDGAAICTPFMPTCADYYSSSSTGRTTLSTARHLKVRQGKTRQGRLV